MMVWLRRLIFGQSVYYLTGATRQTIFTATAMSAVFPMGLVLVSYLLIVWGYWKLSADQLIGSRFYITTEVVLLPIGFLLVCALSSLLLVHLSIRRMKPVEMLRNA